MDELIGAFSLERVSKSGAGSAGKSALVQRPVPARQIRCGTGRAVRPGILKAKGWTPRPPKRPVIALIKQRATFVSDFWNLTSFMFVAPEQYDPKSTAKF